MLFIMIQNASLTPLWADFAP